jgi:rhodanese-related sulfurtransferase
MQPILLDIREPEEFEVSHLKHAKLADSKRVAMTLLKNTGRDDPVVLYCSVGYRSSKMAQELQEAGFRNVHNLEGSIFQWRNEGKPVYRDGVMVPQVHPYDRNWGQLLRREFWYKPDR